MKKLILLITVILLLPVIYAQTCDDTDQGPDYYIIGTITYLSTITAHCEGATGCGVFNQSVCEVNVSCIWVPTESSTLTKTDYCKDNSTLVEYYCKDGILNASTEYDCVEGCNNGACGCTEGYVGNPFCIGDTVVQNYQQKVLRPILAIGITECQQLLKTVEECDVDQMCANGNCTTKVECGNGVCDSGENCGNCVADCACSTGKICQNNVCVTAPAETICNDGIDNDNDGNIDCFDTDCEGAAVCKKEICNNNIDDNENDLIDCKDPDCNGYRATCIATNGCAGTKTCSNGVFGNCVTTLNKCKDGTCKTQCPPGFFDKFPAGIFVFVGMVIIIGGYYWWYRKR